MSLPEHEDEFRAIQYQVPRNYLVWMDKWDGGPQTLVRFKVAFPSFAPLTDANQSCMSSAPAYRPPGCAPIEFNIRRGGAYDPPDEMLFENKRNLFHSQSPKRGPYGFELYETGPPEARINTYRKMTAEHLLVIDCLIGEKFGQSGDTPSICNMESRLDSGNVLEYHLDGSQLKDAVEIDAGVRRVIRQFRADTQLQRNTK